MRADPRLAEESRAPRSSAPVRRFQLAATLLLVCAYCNVARAQSGNAPATAPETTEQKVEHLSAAIAQAEAQMQAYQKQLLELRQELAALQRQVAAEKGVQPAAPESATPNPGDALAAAVASLNEIRERQQIEESQIATHDVTKVETQSKYPLKVSGLLLFNGFVNTKQVDISAAPSYVLSGPGSTGLSIRQSVLGLDARGPRLFGASSYANLRVDFFANNTQSNYAASGVVRLRTAHAGLNWKNTEAFFELDRSILEPNEPSSLVAIAQPELAWEGNLWNWNPQVGLTHQFALSDLMRIKAQAAFIDTSDPQSPAATPSTSPVTQTERSRLPGSEARIAFQRGADGSGTEIGVGGYFSPHRNGDGDRFDAWAATMDFRTPLSRLFELTANAYRGQALAGLGAGGYVNYYYVYVGTTELARSLDDVGGWAQLKAHVGPRVELNAGYGADNPFAKEIHQAISFNESVAYAGLARNRAFYSNVIYSPSAYLLFSIEYKRLWTNYATGPTNSGDSIGIGAGYKF
jgi:hypothetical protein